ncbi:MAG: hypothetical protein JSR46_02175 [Verrucomicrobia bacterium]|nr:hypothetical protein [Verrucomicrobiota bacterium]
MYKKIEAGHGVAQNIVKGEIQKGHAVDEVINVDWFMRAHMAKQNQLFLKGTAKMADPEGLFAKFVLNSKSMLDGDEDDPYGRASTHYPEQGQNVRAECIQVGKGEFLAYSGTVAKAKKKESPEAIIHHPKGSLLFKATSIGVDASGAGGASLGVAGQENKTFLFMPMHETVYDPKTGNPGKPVQIIAWKAEGHSARDVYTIKLKNWLNKIFCGIDRSDSRARVRARARARCIQFIPLFVPS